MEIQLRVNGKSHQGNVEPRLLLVHFLRDVCGLTGTHIGCETSICGACTVLQDGKAVKSYTVFAVQVDEPRGCVASFHAGEGTLTLWISTQIPHLVRTLLPG